MSVLSVATQKQVEDKLVAQGVVSYADIDSIKHKAEQEKVPFFQLLVSEGKLSDENLTKIVAQATNVPYVNLHGVHVTPEVLALLPEDVAKQYMAVPLGEMQHRLVVAMLDADNVQAVDFLSNKIGKPIKVYSASEEGIREVLKQYSITIDTKMADVFENQVNAASNEISLKGENQPVNQQDQIKTIVQDSPISKALSTILEYAARNRASDVHIEPMEHELKFRIRIDGVLREIMKLPKSTEPALISRIKILSNLKIDEHRIPQDGQFTIKVDEKPIDLRIAISPVVWGEQVVIRLLDKTGTNLKLDDMGYRGRPLRSMRAGIARSDGMVLTSGPTGSGKSTTLYALIQEIKNDAINIVTLEDPVEYKIDGVNQIQVNPEVGLTFATGLRSILRQDPNVVMVGEIRDSETANLAVQAALTGHLVLSTLHTNSAAGILPRLLDMGVEPFLIASTVHTVSGQRLVRTISPEGKQEYESNAAETIAINETLKGILPEKEADVKKIAEDLGYENLPLANKNAYTLSKGKDTPETPNGYRGRMGLYEVFEVTEAIQELIVKRATSLDIQKEAQKQGMLTMRQDGYLKALSGETTLLEVNRVASIDNA
jgi:type IV pilus assembly protein PilB